MEVADTRIGIEIRNVSRIFAHGFTTKPSGHGFGQHICANAAYKMNGSLSVQSPDAGRGATFNFSLLYMPAMAHA